MKNRKILLLSISLLLCGGIKAQDRIDNTHRYLIFTFEITHKISKAEEHYYWITPLDSIKKKNAFQIFPLYTEEYSKDALDRCREGKPIDIFTATTVTNFSFNNEYLQTVKNLMLMIKNRRVEIETFKKQWGTEKGQETVKVYVTPIVGEFCNCLQSHGKASYGFRGVSYLPISSFTHDQNFWNSTDARVVKYVDYSYVEYSSHYPSNMHGNSNLRIKGSIQTF